MKIDMLAMGEAVGLMAISWAALPVVYFLLVKKNKEAIKKDESMG